MGGEWAFVVIMIICGLSIYGLAIYRVYIRKEEGYKTKSETTVEAKKTEEKDKPSAIHYSNGYVEKNKDTLTAESHKIVMILKDSRTDWGKKWLCPNCEVENPLSENKCLVCNYHYKK